MVRFFLAVTQVQRRRESRSPHAAAALASPPRRVEALEPDRRSAPQPVAAMRADDEAAQVPPWRCAVAPLRRSKLLRDERPRLAATIATATAALVRGP